MFCSFLVYSKVIQLYICMFFFIVLPRKFHGWRSLVGYSPWGRKESDTTEQLHFQFSLSIMVYHRILNIVLCAVQ